MNRILYKIEKIKTLYCRVIKVERKVKDNIIIIHIGLYESGEFLCTIVRNDSIYNDMLKYQENRKRMIIEKVLICPNVSVYHKLTWDDVHRGKCSVRNLDEIERDKNGKTIVYDKIVMFVNIENNLKVNNDEEAKKWRKRINREREISCLLEKYIAINDPNAQNALNHRNSFSQRHQKEELYNDYYENYNYDVDSTPENTVMDALENGMGELFGY